LKQGRPSCIRIEKKTSEAHKPARMSYELLRKALPAMKPAAIIELLAGLGSFVLVICGFLLPALGGPTILNIYDVDPLVLGVSCGLLLSGVITDTVVLSLKPKPALRVLAIIELTLGAVGLIWYSRAEATSHFLWRWPWPLSRS
jgi:hypothetical protein